MWEKQIPVPEALLSTKPKLLIVDDDEKLVRSLVRYCERKAEFEIKTAYSGFGAGIALNEFKPHVIILDIMLGDLDGRELFATIKKDPQYKEVKVIAISGYIKEAEISDLFETGFHGYIAKPFKMHELTVKIDKLLGREAEVSGA